MQRASNLEDPSPSKFSKDHIKATSNQEAKAHSKTGKLLRLQSFFSRLFNKIRGRKNATNKKDDFYKIIKQLKSSSKHMKADEKEILINFLRFGNKTVEDVMIPRSDIAAVKKDIALEELNKQILQLAHTRTLVYDDTMDNIIGFIHIKDLFQVLAKKQNFQLQKIMRKHIIAAPSMKLIDLLAEMQVKRTHIAVVVDEYGGTDGMVTIEDIMEEIVGRIADEHDTQIDSDSYKIVSKNTILSSSRVEVEDLEKVLGVKLKEEDDEFDTIGGLILAKVGNVPSSGTIIQITPDVVVEIIDANPRTLKQIKLVLKNGEIVSPKE